MSFNSYILKLVEDHRICQDDIYYLWGSYWQKTHRGAFLFPREMVREVVEPYDKLDLMCMVRDADHFHLGEDWFSISGDKGWEQLNSSNFIPKLIDIESIFKWIDETGQTNFCSPDLYSIWEEYKQKEQDYSFTYLIYSKVTITNYTGSATTVSIPSEIEGKPVTRVERYSFENCYELEKVTIPNSVTEIGSRAFFDCSNLKNITIPESVIDIGYHACGYLRSAYGSGDIPIHDFVIIGTKGSETEKYAKDNGFRFDAISK